MSYRLWAESIGSRADRSVPPEWPPLPTKGENFPPLFEPNQRLQTRGSHYTASSTGNEGVCQPSTSAHKSSSDGCWMSLRFAWRPPGFSLSSTHEAASDTLIPQNPASAVNRGLFKRACILKIRHFNVTQRHPVWRIPTLPYPDLASGH